MILLRNVDLKWMDHLDAMDDLRGSVGLNAYAQRNPLTEYQIVGGDMFDEMVLNIREDTIRAWLSATPKKEVKREAVAHVTGQRRRKSPRRLRRGRDDRFLLRRNAGGPRSHEEKDLRGSQRPLPLRLRKEIQKMLRSVRRRSVRGLWASAFC